MGRRASRSVSVVAVFATAIVGGAAAAFAASCFIWLEESGIKLLWDRLPDKLGVHPYDSWWLFAVPLVGAVLVGLGHRFLGHYPEPLEDVIDGWQAGDRVEPRTMPATILNSLASLVFGGPVGFEAALTGIVAGAATAIGRRVRSVGALVRQAWGTERVESLPHAVRSLPYLVSGLAGLATYRNMPFGVIDASFRFGTFDGHLDGHEAVVALLVGAVATVPVAWAAHVVSRAEESTRYQRSPVAAAALGALLFSLLAVPNQFVLFSGQQGIQSLQGLSDRTLLYLTVAKWLALVIALSAGWRGGPVFPLFFAVASLALVVDGPLGVPPDVIMIAAIAAVSTVFVKGKVVPAFVLTLYVAPLSWAGAILLGSLGAAAVLRATRPLGILPPARPAAVGAAVPAPGPAPAGSDEAPPG